MWKGTHPPCSASDASCTCPTKSLAQTNTHTPSDAFVLPPPMDLLRKTTASGTGRTGRCTTYIGQRHRSCAMTIISKRKHGKRFLGSNLSIRINYLARPLTNGNAVCVASATDRCPVSDPSKTNQISQTLGWQTVAAETTTAKPTCQRPPVKNTSMTSNSPDETGSCMALLVLGCAPSCSRRRVPEVATRSGSICLEIRATCARKSRRRIE